MSGYNMLEQAAKTCCILLQLAIFYGFLNGRQSYKFLSTLGDIAKKCKTL
jgi:hypothetical protein